MAFLEGVTVRVSVTNLVHDIDGAITTADSADFTVYYPDGSIWTSGSLVYVDPALGWTGTFDAPPIDDGLTTTLTVLCVIVYNGATFKATATLDTADIPVTGV